MFPKCVISCIVVFEGRVTRVVYDDTHQALRRSCVKFSQTVVVVLKNSFWNQETVTEVERLIFRAFQCEMEMEYITVRRLLLVPVEKVCESIKNWFQLIYLNSSWLLYCVLLPCVYDIETSHVSGSWLQFELYPHVLQPHRILYGFSVMIQKQFFRIFQLFAPEVKHFHRIHTWKNSQIIFI